MSVALEISIERMTGVLLAPQRREYPEVQQVYVVCPHCKREVVPYLFSCDAYVVSAWSCREHGDVVPIKSAVVNGRPYQPDWSAA